MPNEPADWKAIADELAYALEVHVLGGRGEFADYPIQEANQFAKDVIARYDEAKATEDRE